MKFHKLFLLLYIVLVLYVPKTYAHLYADVEFDFSKGWIQITPPEYSEDTSQIAVIKSGFGIRFGGTGSSASPHSDQKRDAYLLLSGGPDNLSFRIVQYICANESDAIGAIVTAWKFETLKGHIQIQGQFLMSKEVVKTLGESLVCTTQYRKKMANYNLATLPGQSGPFLLSHNRKIISIRWDASHDNDPLTKESRKTIEQIDEIIKK